MTLSKKAETFFANKEAQKLVNHIASISPEMLLEEAGEIIAKANEIRSKFWEIELEMN